MSKYFNFFATDLECKAEDGKYFLTGHIDSGDRDLVNDIISRKCMESISSQFQNKSFKLDLEHETITADRKDLTKIPLGKSVSELLDIKGNKVKFQLNPHYKRFDSDGKITQTFDEVWASCKSGMYDAFSIAYIPTKVVRKSINGAHARLLDDVKMVNVALTGSAINPAATITNVMAKSLEWLKKQEELKMDAKVNEKTALDKVEAELKALKEKVEEDKKVAEAKAKLKPENNTEGKPDPVEQKSFVEVKAFAELKSQVDGFSERFDKMEAILTKALPSGNGPEDAAKIAEAKAAQTEVKASTNPLDWL